MLERVYSQSPFSSRVTGLILVSVVGLGVGSSILVGLIVGPSVVVSETGDTSPGIEAQPLFIDNGSTVTFESDTTARSIQRLSMENRETGAMESFYIDSRLVYDAETKRVLVEGAVDIEDNSSARWGDGERIVSDTYFSWNESTDQYDGYTIRRIYNSGNQSWGSIEPYDDACQLNETAVVEPVAGDRQYQSQIPYGNSNILYSGGSALFEIQSETVGDEQRVTIEEGRYRAADVSGGVIHVKNSTGQTISVRQQSLDADDETNIYALQQSNVSATGTVYNGLQRLPITMFWERQDFTLQYSVSVNQSTDVTIDEPSWVQEYTQTC